ncbi:hypothetical protein EDC96DRAFT_544109 [Choanephora cucurbitarum]|nr:hypothetical protein EDC96DRAFT_544109 [Choanephora cucurbitarum]
MAQTLLQSYCHHKGTVSLDAILLLLRIEIKLVLLVTVAIFTCHKNFLAIRFYSNSQNVIFICLVVKCTYRQMSLKVEFHVGYDGNKIVVELSVIEKITKTRKREGNAEELIFERLFTIKVPINVIASRMHRMHSLDHEAHPEIKISCSSDFYPMKKLSYNYMLFGRLSALFFGNFELNPVTGWLLYLILKAI